MTTPLEQIKERIERLKVIANYADDGITSHNRALDEVITLLPSIIQEVVGAIIPDEIGMAEVEFKGKVPMDVLSDVMEFTTDPVFHKGWNQCREAVLASLKEESK